MENSRKAGINTVNATKLVASLIGEYTPRGELPSLKYGREMEAIAKAFYLEILKKIITMLSIVIVDNIFTRPNSF